MYRTYFDAYLISRKADGASPKTIDWHTSSLKSFTRWLEGTGKVDTYADPESWTPQLFREFIIYLQGSGLSAFTVRTKVNSLLAFARWLHLEGYTATNVGARVKRPKVPQSIKPPFTDAELKALLDAAKTSLRDTALLMLLVDCGLRASEVAHIQLVHVYAKQGLLHVKEGKGSKDRLVPMSPKCIRALTRYTIRERHKGLHADSPFLFLSKTDSQFTASGLLQLVRKLGKKAGVGDVHPHRFRHTFAISYLRNGGDVFTLHRVMGHSDLATTRVYLHLQTEDLLRGHLVASPLDHLMKKGADK
jgi:site-specific recombinase XerD